jgi:hypothetical protein
MISALRAAGDIITPIQTVTQETLKVTLGVAEKLINLMKELEVSGFGAAESSIKAIKTGITMTDTVTDKIDIMRKALEAPEEQSGGNRDYVSAENVPYPSFDPAKEEAYKLAMEPRAGLKIPARVQKALDDMDKLAKQAIEAKKAAEQKKKEFENAKKMAQNIKNAPGKLKQQAKNSINAAKNNAKKAVKNAKQEISTTKKALKGGRKSQRRKSKKARRKSKKRYKR